MKFTPIAAYKTFPREWALWSFLRKCRNPFAGLYGFSRTNTPGYFLIASRHWPHLLCWSWSLTFTTERPKSWKPRASLQYRRIEWAWFALVWQPYGWMVQSWCEADAMAFVERRLPTATRRGPKTTNPDSAEGR